MSQSRRSSGKPAGKAPAKKTPKRGSSTAEQRVHTPKAAGSTPAPATTPKPTAKRAPAKKAAPPKPARKKAQPTEPAQPSAAGTAQRLLAAEPAPDPETGLHPRVRAFADEYLRDLNGTAAYLRVHPDAKVSTAATESCRILRNPKVREYVAARREQMALAVDFSKEDVIRELVALVRADPNELTQMRQISCDECWPPEKDEGGEKRLPMWTEPNPECPHCNGNGIPRPWFADTRKLSPAARRLFSSVHVTRDGMRINLRDQDGALDKLAKVFGAYEEDNKQKQGTLAEALSELFGQLHSAGGSRLPIAGRGK